MTCAHSWISNSGDGGKPKFRWLFGHRVMKVRCAICKIFAWVNLAEWRDRDQGGPR